MTEYDNIVAKDPEVSKIVVTVNFYSERQKKKIIKKEKYIIIECNPRYKFSQIPTRNIYVSQPMHQTINYAIIIH